MRARFFDQAAALLDALPDQIIEALKASGSAQKTAPGKVEVMEALGAFRIQSSAWLAEAQRQWRRRASERAAGKTNAGPATQGGDLSSWALVGNDEVDRTVMIGRLVLIIMDEAGQELVDLRTRMQGLERSADFKPRDVLRPETFAKALFDAWDDCGLTRTQWVLAQEAIRPCVAQGLRKAYKSANTFLMECGVSAEIDLRARMRRTPDRLTTGMGPPPGMFANAQGIKPGTLYSSDFGEVGPSASASLAVNGAPVAAAVSPLGVLQQQRAQGVLGHLRQFALRHGAPLAAEAGAQPVSSVLAQALAPATPTPPRPDGHAPDQSASADGVDQAAQQLSTQAAALKDKTDRPDEKAAIEIVSLMFQAILTDERLSPALRVWFGRLQVPVLRVALGEPEFFAASNHPARQLIDRMGACALGLENAEVEDGRLEQEIRRIVQMIEQYPETGQKVFQVLLREFEKFLGDALSQGKPVQKFATLAQQIEQKDALAIQYTIELRKLLGTAPVGEAVRQFLFRVWPEVLALSAVRRGAQDAETMRLKYAAVDLLWAVSPKADRADRQRVTQFLPGILHTLRSGMRSLTMPESEQDRHIHQINQAVTQAFQAPGQGITPAQMDQLAHALTGLEDEVTDDPKGDLLLDPVLLEQILGVGGKELDVIATGGVRPDADMLHWAREQQTGQWFTLQYQGAPAQVQYVWRSARGQLHLFAAPSGKSYLVQTRRLASYLQAGLIAPVENETLTTRATRHALTQLGQEPERLLR